MTQMDGPGFSLCAMPLEIVMSCISKWHSQNRSRKNGGLEYFGPERDGENLVSKRRQNLVGDLVELTLLYIGGSLL